MYLLYNKMSSINEYKTNGLTELIPYWDKLVSAYNYALHNASSQYEIDMMQDLLYPVLEDIKNKGIDFTREDIYIKVYNSYIRYYNHSTTVIHLMNIENMVDLRQIYCTIISKLDEDTGDFIFEYVPEITQNIE